MVKVIWMEFRPLYIDKNTWFLKLGDVYKSFYKNINNRKKNVLKKKNIY